MGVALSRKLKDKKKLAFFLEDIGVYYSQRGSPQKAMEYFQESISLQNELGDKNGLGALYNNMGIAYFSLGEKKKALDYYLKSVKVKIESGDTKSLNRTYNNIGNFYLDQGNYRLALEYHYKSLKLREALGDDNGMSYSYANIGTIYEELDQLDQAMSFYLKGLACAQRAKNNVVLANLYYNMGNLYQTKGEYTRALDNYLKGMDINKEMGNERGMAEMNVQLGTLYAAQKKYQIALEFINQGVKTLQHFNLKDGLAMGYIELGRCYQELGEDSKALHYLNMAYPIAKELDKVIFLRHIAELLSLIYARQKDFQKAHAFHVLFKEKNDSIQNEENFRKITSMEMQYDFDKKEKLTELERKKKDLQKEAELKHQRFLKFVFSGFAVFLAVVFFVLFRFKARDNRRLYEEIQQRTQAEHELLKSIKLETVGILSAGITHDFSNLLTGIAGNVSLAKESLKNSEATLLSYLDSAQKACIQAAELVRNFLALSEGGWAEKKNILLTDIFRETLAAPEIKNIPVSVSMPSESLYLHADERQIRQVLSNLLVNADEATTNTQREKKILLSANCMALKEGNSFGLAGGDYVEILVQDNGGGIQQELLEKIFDPYFSTKRRGTQKGMGLSLAVCAAVVQRHHGYIYFTSQIDQGTTARVFLPQVEHYSSHPRNN